MHLLAERAMLRENANALLAELGGTATEVAASLMAMGVSVSPASAGDSPVARYLYAVIGPDTLVKHIEVTTRWLVLQTHRSRWSTIKLRLPHPVREFIASVNLAPASDEPEVPSEGT